MVNYLKELVILVLVLALGISFLHSWRVKRQLASAEQERAVLAVAFEGAFADSKALSARLNSTKKLKGQEDAAKDSLRKAAAATPAWADQPVPAAVLDSLR